MINFNLKSTAIYQVLAWEKYFRLVSFLKKFLIFGLIINLLYNFFIESANWGVSIILFSFYIIFWLNELFFEKKLKNPELKYSLEEVLQKMEEFNLAEFLDFKVAKSVWQAIHFCKKRKLPQIPSEAILIFLLEKWPRANFIFSRALLDLKGIKRELKDYLNGLKSERFQEIFAEDFQKVILEAVKIAKTKNHKTIGVGDILISQSQINPLFKEYLIAANLKSHDIENLTRWLEFLEKSIEEREKKWEYKNLIKRGSIGKDWAAGYALTLDKFSIDWTEVVRRKGFPEIIGHQKEIEAMERNLARRESNNNVLIVGESGSGRKSMIEALAKKSVLGESLPGVNYKRVVQLDLSSLIAQIENPEEVSNLLDTIFREVLTAGNIILVIDEFHNFVGEKTLRPGVVDISGVLSPFLSLPQFQIVAITTFEGLHKKVEQNPSILSLFEKVEVSEISERETLMLLENLTLQLESKYKIFVSYQVIRDIINFCAKYLPATPFPEKAMDLLEEVMVHTSQSKEKVVLSQHVAKIVSEKTQIPVGEVEIKEKEILLNLENLIHQRIINQEEAVKEVSAALRRARANITTRSGPMGTFLFLGPTGVGKTETSKALAEIYFGSENRMIRLDMSEFQNIGDIARLIGSTEEDGILTTQVRENPFSLILLDELEKAHKNILNLFLQVLDEGHLTDGLGRKVDFKNSIIIATSNAGYQVILDALREGKEMFQIKEELLDFVLKEGIFRPEFINRFDAVVVFKALTRENLLDITGLLLKKLQKNLSQKEIEFITTDDLKEKIVELGFDPIYGARQIKRVIQDKVENILAQAFLSGEIRAGNKVEIDSKEFKLTIK